MAGVPGRAEGAAGAAALLHPGTSLAQADDVQRMVQSVPAPENAPQTMARVETRPVEAAPVPKVPVNSAGSAEVADTRAASISARSGLPGA